MKDALKKIFVTSFFGWENWRFLILQIIYLFTTKESIFSQKKVFSIIATCSGIGVVLCYVWSHRHSIQNSELMADVGILFCVGGYHVIMNERGKRNNRNQSDDNQPDPQNQDQSTPPPTN